MAIKTEEGYKCFFCEEVYDREQEADKCTKDHNLVYVPMTPEELNRLVHSFYFQDQFPPESLIRRLKEIQKREGKK